MATHGSAADISSRTFSEHHQHSVSRTKTSSVRRVHLNHNDQRREERAATAIAEPSPAGCQEDSKGTLEGAGVGSALRGARSSFSGGGKSDTGSSGLPEAQTNG